MGLFQLQSAVASLSDADLIERWLARDFEEQALGFAEQELINRGIDPAAPVARSHTNQRSRDEEVVDWSFLIAVVTGKVFAFFGLIIGFSICKVLLEKYLGIGGVIPSVILAMPFIYFARATYASRGGKWALVIVIGGLALVVLFIVFAK